MRERNTLDYQTFNRLRNIYIIALGAIALFTSIGQFYIQRYLDAQIDDSKIINISGRQRMLSQKISKELLLLTYVETIISKKKHIVALEKTIGDWKSSHEILLRYNDSIQKKHRDSTEVKKMFLSLQPYFETIYNNSYQALQLVKNDNIKSSDISPYLFKVITEEPLFLKQMDAIVFQYEKEAQKKITRLKRIEYILFGCILLILILEFLLIFRPVALRIKKNLSDLLLSQQESEKMVLRAEELRKNQQESVQELITLTKAIDQTLLYARVDDQGTIKSLGKRFIKVLHIGQGYENKNLGELMNLGEVQQHRLQQFIFQNNGGVFNEVFEIKTNKIQKIWLDISILTVYRDTGNTERLVLCSDITKQQEAQNQVERLSAVKYRKKEELQKLNASQIVEAQEEERKRIAKEIHDSIGQMLTALKFNIESINFENLERAEQKINGLKTLSKDLIRGIRIATFNLTPPELKDYGVCIAIQKMVKQLSKLTSKNILIENNADSELRFDTLVETNLYRVTQEALNNAIKYADAAYILISINSTPSMFSITIDDNGKGFDMSKIPESPQDNAEGGMGLFFMKERMNYINGNIYIVSTPQNGTRVTLNYSL